MDRLSSLPDDIVLHILSFFLKDTKSFVRFSAVSRQWNTHLESFVRDFFFDDESLSPSAILEFLESQDVPKIGTFHLSFRPPQKCRGEASYGKVIDFATSRFVNNLAVNFNYDRRYGKVWNTVLWKGLACPSLKTLRLSCCSLGDTFSFPTVTTMHLENCSIQRFDLFLACPILKELCLVDPDFYLLRGKTMKPGAKLVRLSVEYNRPTWWGITKISAPGLEYFRFVVDHGVDMEYFPVVDFPSLQCAVIDAAHPMGIFDLIKNNQKLSKKLRGERRKQNRFCITLFKLLQGLHKAEYLSLSPAVIQVLSMLPNIIERHSSPFARLKTLALLENPVDMDVLPIPANALVYLLGGSYLVQRCFSFVNGKEKMASSILRSGYARFGYLRL
ncbi:hypothetical protein Tsubulata_027789 [Turnera subulata]|uniref:F-box domain-containing protein n=1 Tax=Turnera subulata TaxID=218843 RepID=A0A9Q0F135_9ROSI|nr:hypothetical protein Tsubulata_027789 [Turnera subulata]